MPWRSCRCAADQSGRGHLNMQFLTSVAFVFLVMVGPSLGGQAPAFQNDDFRITTKKTATLWHNIPFYAAGDMAQYQATMARNRDEVRGQMLGELTGVLDKLAARGANIESMIEPLSNIIVVFDQMHDLHRAKDQSRIHVSLENQFKASLDRLFVRNDVRDADRRIQVSRGTDPDLLKAYIQGISTESPRAKRISQSELGVRYSLEVYQQIDYLSFGTFSNLGNGNFQVSLQLQGARSGVTRSFMAVGGLNNAIDNLAQQVFNFFQKNAYPEWNAPQTGLQWLPMPANPTRDSPQSAQYGYTFLEAVAYCGSRGYRLPYARELLFAETGGSYKKGGIDPLENSIRYPVLDHRKTISNYVLIPGLENRTGGAIQPNAGYSAKGKFWCVKGEPSARILLFEKLWELHREHSFGDGSNKTIYIAVETLLYELGDSDVDTIYFDNRVTLNPFERVQRLHCAEDAQRLLREKGIVLEIPPQLPCR